MTGSVGMLDISIDNESRIVTIAGIHYSFSFFEELGENGAAIGTMMRIESRQDGVVTLTRIRETDEAA